MQFGPNESEKLTLTRFKAMLKTNDVLFFDSDEFEIIINHYLDNGKMAMAKKAIRIGLEQHPTSTSLKLFLVEIFVIENKLDKAEVLIDEIFEIEKSNEDVYIQKANIHSRRNEHVQAIYQLETALDISLDKSEIYSFIGIEYLYLEDFNNALENFILCLTDDPDNRQALHNIVYCYDILERHQEAIDFLLEYIEIRPYNEVAWQNIGKQYYILKNYEKALEAYDYAIISDDAFVGAYLEKGKVLERLGYYEKAIECYVITLRLEDPSTFALLRAGKCYEKLGNYGLAKKFYKQCIDQDSLLDKGWLAIARLYKRQKKYKPALAYIKKAINIDNTNIKYWKCYASIHYKLRDFKNAAIGYTKCIELADYNLQHWLNLADTLIKIAKWNDAKKVLENASEFFHDEVKLNYRLAGIYYKTLDLEKGAFYLSTALYQDPDAVNILKNTFPFVYFNPDIQAIISKHSSKI